MTTSSAAIKALSILDTPRTPISTYGVESGQAPSAISAGETGTADVDITDQLGAIPEPRRRQVKGR